MTTARFVSDPLKSCSLYYLVMSSTTYQTCILKVKIHFQEALYNIARAYHHIGLVSLATTYYDKVLAMPEKDYPIPKLPNENQDPMDYKRPGYCDLRREAAYNLHLIYKKSGAFDLARQVLKDYLTF